MVSSGVPGKEATPLLGPRLPSCQWELRVKMSGPKRGKWHPFAVSQRAFPRPRRVAEQTGARWTNGKPRAVVSLRLWIVRSSWEYVQFTSSFEDER
jgi:hypothetical protein